MAVFPLRELLDMTLEEKLIWAMTFVTARDKDAEGRGVGRRDDRLLMYAQKAAEAVADLHHANHIAETEDPRGRIDTMAALLLRQMTRK